MTFNSKEYLFSVVYLTFFMATSMVPILAPSILLKATMLTPASMIAMQNLPPVTSAASTAADTARFAEVRLRLVYTTNYKHYL